MNKMISVVVFVLISLLATIQPLYAWTYCYKDVLYITEYRFDIEAGNVIRGQALTPEAAPLTGYVNTTNNSWSFSIGYLNDNSRHYWINASTLKGYSWGILGTDSSFYDKPRSASLVNCTMQPSPLVEGETGASK